MKLLAFDYGAVMPITKFHKWLLPCGILLLLVLTAPAHAAGAQQPTTVPVAKCAPLAVAEVVQNVVQMNLRRAHALHSYQGTRIYRVEYHGFPGPRSAEMVVNVRYSPPGTKAFVIQSTTGSTLLIDRVLKKLLDAEMEADVEIQRRSSLTDDNYRFMLTGCEAIPSGVAYVLDVQPRRDDKFLYRGRVWVDADDFALVRVEAAPAKNPSFWTKKAEIVQAYMKVSDFWLPEYNHSSSAIRLGGHAELTIDYMDYVITGASQVSALSISQSAPPGDNIRAQE